MLKSITSFVLISLFLAYTVEGRDSTHQMNSEAGDNLVAAAIFKESGEYEKAISILENSFYLESSDEAKRYLSRLYFLSAQENNALKEIKKIKTKTWLDYLYLGLIYDNLGKNAPALRNYKKSINFKKSTIAYFRSGKIYRRKKDFKRASDFFSKVLEEDSSVRIANFYLGECLLKRGLKEQAYLNLSKAHNFYPKNKEIESLLSQARKKLGQDYFKTRAAKQIIKRQRVKLPGYMQDKDAPLVRVGISQGLNEFSFSCGGEFIIKDDIGSYKGEAGRIYTLARKGRKLFLIDFQEKNELKDFNNSISIASIQNKGLLFPFNVLDVSYGKGDFWQKKLDRVYQGELTAILIKNELILINSLSIEDYLKGVLSAEIPADSAYDALYAQAVAGRTLALRNRNRHKAKSFDFCADVHCQVYHGASARTKATDKAVDLTRGEILTFKDKPIEAFYHSNCGGCLSADSFGEIEYLNAKIDSATGSIPGSSYEQEKWLINEPDTYSKRSKRSSYRWQRIYDREDFVHIFDSRLEDLKAVNPRIKGDCFRYKEIEVILADKTINLTGGLKIRSYFDRLRSSAFKSEIKFDSDRRPEFLIFWGGGFGHGAGMSQEGAINMAKDEVSYQDILKHYYPKAELKKAY